MTSWRGSLRGLSVGLLGGMMESRASRRVMPLALPSFLSTFQPLYQAMLVEASIMLSPCHHGNSDHSVSDGGSKISLSGLLHLDEDHRGDFLREEGFILPFKFDLELRLSSVTDDVERPVLHITLHRRIIELSTNQTLGVEDGVCRIHGHLILSCISDEPLRVSKTHIGGSGPVTLVVGDDLYLSMLEDSHTGVGV